MSGAPLRIRARRLAFGLRTLLGLGRRGFFIPYRYAAATAPAGYPGLEPAFRTAEPGFREVLARIDEHADDLLAIAAGGGPARFDQDWFPRLDAAAAYATVRHARPARIVEIGSGHSTRFMAQAVRDGGLATRITAIDPAPRASLAGLGVRHERRLLARADPAISVLAPGDILFVDSSHVAMPGTDVDRLAGDILPRLPAGVLVHLHDILLPDPYPPEWTWRGYNEASVAAALIGRGAFDLVFASHWVMSRHADWLAGSVLTRVTLRASARETSLWLRTR